MKYFLMVLFAAASVSAVPAQPVVLSEDAVIERLRSHNLGLQAERAALEAGERTARTAANVLIPSVRASTGVIRTNEEIVPMPTGEPYSLSYASTIEAQLQLSVALIEGTRTAGFARDAAVASYHETMAQSEERARIAFYALLLLREGVEVGRWGRETAALHLGSVNDAHAAGLVPERVLVAAESAVVEAETTVQRLEAEYRDAGGALATTLSYPVGSWIEPIGALLDPQPQRDTPPGLNATTLSDRADIRRLDAQLNLQESALRTRVLQQRTPSLSVTQSWNATLLDPLNPDNPLPRSSMDRGTLSIMLSMPLDSLLPVSAGSVAIRNQRDALRSLELMREQATRFAAEEVDVLLRAMERSAAHINALAGRAQLAEQIHDLTREAYNEGLASYLELRDAERELQGARFELLNERYRYTITRIRYEYATGER